MHEIVWPEDYLPGFTDNFSSNEVIVAELTSSDIWPLLSHAHLWPTYYANSAGIRFHDGKGPELEQNVRFDFITFGFLVEAEIVEYKSPVAEEPGRVAWHGWIGENDTRLDIYHAWLIEDLSQGRVRILTQETQKGKPAKDLAKAKPNPMINGHQDWLDGLVNEARKRKAR